jgi:prepilin signal peptidase PulO-like enzyme (type II secretory pathway)
MIPLPVELRMAVLFLVGTMAGSLINLAVYRLTWNPRPFSPWSAAPAAASPRRWTDCIPVVGWLGLRREAALHGSGFWIRPMVVELLAGVGFAALYWWEIGNLGLFARPAPPVPPTLLHIQYACHVLLASLMLAASLIDADEKIIPDAITVPGTWLGLLIAAVYPWSLLPNQILPVNGGLPLGFLHVAAPQAWPAAMNGWPLAGSLALGLGCWWLWCAALSRRTWYARHGWQRAFRLAVARLARDASTIPLVLMGLVGSCGVAAVWYWRGDHWVGLLSALVGMLTGGLMIWLVRIVGTAVLKREAMGFGDVTLMAMIGSFLGWQTCLVVFFLAPFAGLVIGLITLLLRRGHEIPYGPFLCLAAAFVVVKWAPVWDWASEIFALGWVLPIVLLVCLVLMALLLGAWRLILGLIG